MLPKGTVVATNIWKRFRADRTRMLLRDELERLRARVAGNGDVGWRWVLRDIDLVAKPGESIGVVGANGSGKSTLLRILTQVMFPYAGRLEVSGKVGALIDVRAGIHPDLTGRENIGLYGSILGYGRRRVVQMFDEIVAFAELGDAIDRQVKFYSSGMGMRLGFSVAALLQPDILIVDEVLAVGDASFQQKSLEKMRSLLADGTTLVFVSHDLATVEATCGRGIWLEQGVAQATGDIREVLTAYRRYVEERAESTARSNDLVRLLKAEVTGESGGPPATQELLEANLRLESLELGAAKLYLGVSEGTAAPIFSMARDFHLTRGETKIRVRVARLPLGRGRYYLWVGMYDSKGHDLIGWHPAAQFEVAGPDIDSPPRAIKRLAPVHVDVGWQLEHSR